MKTAVVYWSGTGNTEAMAQAVAQGMTDAGAEAVLLTPDQVQPGDLNAYDAIAFGCPAMGSEVLEGDLRRSARRDGTGGLPCPRKGLGCLRSGPGEGLNISVLTT